MRRFVCEMLWARCPMNASKLAMRIASFDKQAIVETKNFVNIASLRPDGEIAPEWDACIASIQRPARHISRATSKIGWDTTWVNSGAEAPSKRYVRRFKR